MKKKPMKRPKPPSTSSATLPIIFTDRPAFETYVGSYTLLTLDAPGQVVEDPATSSTLVTYGNLITFTFDSQGGVGVNADGTVTLGMSNLIASGAVLEPVMAFGFDIVSGDPRGWVFIAADGTEFGVSLANLHFLGLVSENPFTASLFYRPLLDPVTNQATGGFTIDNVAIKAAP